jgi:Glycosyltransferase family 28 C-terminal domain
VNDFRASASKPPIDLIFIDAGGGHRASATALKEVIDRQNRPWQTRLVNLREVLGSVDPIHDWTGIPIENFYNRLLKYGITFGSAALLRAGQAMIRLTHQRQVASFAEYWRERPPGLVLSLVPNFNRSMLEGLRAADRSLSRQNTPMATILTDLADCPPHFWIERQEQYLICGTATAAEQAIRMGHPAHQVFLTSGMIVRQEFYEQPAIDRRRERRALGLDPELPTGIVMFGGYASHQMTKIARCIAAAGLRAQMIFMCGHNAQLAAKLVEMQLPFPCIVQSFTREVARLMSIADFYIGKPGPGSISEALVMGLPAIVERNAWTMVQERFNTDWLVRNEVGIVLRSFNDVAAGVTELLARLSHFRSRVAAIRNRALFEIPKIVEAMLSLSKFGSDRKGNT